MLAALARKGREIIVSLSSPSLSLPAPSSMFEDLSCEEWETSLTFLSKVERLVALLRLSRLTRLSRLLLPRVIITGTLRSLFLVPERLAAPPRQHMQYTIIKRINPPPPPAAMPMMAVMESTSLSPSLGALTGLMVGDWLTTEGVLEVQFVSPEALKATANWFR